MRKTFNRIAKERYQWGNKNNKCLARLLRKKRSINFMGKIQNKEMVHDSKDIANVFRDFYEQLYSVKQKRGQGQLEACKKEKIKEYVQKENMPRLSEEIAQALESPTTIEEINQVLKESLAGKSPGPDGFTMEYLKKFREILSPRLCTYFNSLGERYGMSKEVSMATITTILKEGKESTLCSSYRPISLLNTDTKVFAKVLASRIRVNVGTSPPRPGWFCARKGG